MTKQLGLVSLFFMLGEYTKYKKLKQYKKKHKKKSSKKSSKHSKNSSKNSEDQNETSESEDVDIIEDYQVCFMCFLFVLHLFLYPYISIRVLCLIFDFCKIFLIFLVFCRNASFLSKSISCRILSFKWLNNCLSVMLSLKILIC